MDEKKRKYAYWLEPSLVEEMESMLTEKKLVEMIVQMKAEIAKDKQNLKPSSNRYNIYNNNVSVFH